MRQVGVALAVCLVTSTFAAGQGRNPPGSTKSKKSSSEAVAVRLAEMQKAIEAQQQQIQHLVEQVQSRYPVGPQFSYVDRNTWSGVGGEPHGLDGMIFTSFRYYLP